MSSMLEVDKGMECGESFRMRGAGVRHMAIEATPKPFNIRPDMLILKRGHLLR